MQEKEETKYRVIQEETKSRIIQRVAGVSLTIGLFVFLTEKGQEVPDRLQVLLVIWVGSLLVSAETLVDLRPRKKQN